MAVFEGHAPRDQSTVAPDGCSILAIMRIHEAAKSIRIDYLHLGPHLLELQLELFNLQSSFLVLAMIISPFEKYS